LRKALKMWIPAWSGHNPSYPAHLVLSAVASTKHSLLFTLSADQRLRIWSLDKCQFLKEYDLTFSPTATGRLLADTPAHLLALNDAQDHGDFLFYLMSYNPLEEGQFTLWGGGHEHGAFNDLVQLQTPIKPDKPAGQSWSVADFFLAEVKTASDSQVLSQNTYERTLRLWVSWKSYISSRLQYTDISHHAPKWIDIMKQGDAEQPPADEEVENTVEFWIDRISAPGRFSDAVLLTALHIYQHRMIAPEQRRDLSSSSRFLVKDLVAGIIGRKPKLHPNPQTGQLDFEKFRLDLSLDFSSFEKTCVELAKAGDEVRRLSFDPVTGEVILVRADGIVAIRNLSGAEVLRWGATGSDGQFHDVVRGDLLRGTLYGDLKEANVRAQVVGLARTAYKFRSAIAVAGTLGDVTAGLLDEVMFESHYSADDRIWTFHGKYVSDEMIARTLMKNDIVSSLAGVTEVSAAFNVLLEVLSTDICQDDTIIPLLPVTSVWADLLTIGVGETVSARWTLLRDCALLLGWLYGTEEDLLENKKVLEGYWSECLRAFKGVNMLRNLANTEVAPSSTKQQSPEDQVAGSMQEMHLDDTTEITHLPLRSNALRYLIEDTLDSSGVGLNATSFPLPMAFSLVVASILTQINFADGYSGMAIRIVSQLLRLGADVEASRFASYLPQSPVGGYVSGHVLLQKGEWEKAGLWFCRVAPILAKSGRAVDFEYAKVILRGCQIEGIGKGLFRYYEHVARLFEGKGAHAQTVYYCQLALAVAQDVRFPINSADCRNRRVGRTIY
jgi:Nucleoporin Nup120/160